MENMQVTNDEFELLQMVFRLSRVKHPPTVEIRKRARPLIERSLIGEDAEGNLHIPFEVQQSLAAHGRLLRTK